MKSANLFNRSTFSQTRRFNSIQSSTTGTLFRPAVFLAIIGLIVGSFYLTSSASSFISESSKTKSIVPTRESANLNDVSSLIASESWSLKPLAVPQMGPPSVATFAGDCSTAKTLFNVQDLDLVVCAKVQNAVAGWRVIWSNARFVAVQSNTLSAGTEDVTFTLTTTSNLGDWRVILVDSVGNARALTSFTVIDAANPTADLGVSKAALETSVAAGSQAVFEVQVTNFGPSSATTVQLTDSVPANTTFSSFALLSGPTGFNCITPGVGSSTGDTICTIASLAKGETAVFLAAYNVISGLPSGTVISNTASVASVSEPPTADPRVFNDSSTSIVTVLAATVEACSLDCPANVVVTADATQGGQPGAFVTFGAAAVTGNCGAVSNSPASGGFFTVGTHSIISSSEIGGASCTFTVTVLDSNPPTITCPTNITVTAPEGETQASVSVGTPTINASGGGTVTAVRSDDTPATFDDNGNVVTPAVVHAVTDPYPIGSTGITWTVTDAGGRKASCTQIVTVVAFGNRDPVTISCPAHVSVTAPSGSCEATIASGTIGTPSTNHTDNVTITPRRSDDRPLSDPFPAGMTTITWTATDDLNGSVASCVQNVTVTAGGGADTTPPALTVPANVVTTTSSCTAIVDDELGTAEATDTGACGGSVTITRTGVPAGFNFPTGTTTITYTATDGAGNTTTGTQTVTVSESPAVPPTITAPADVSAVTGPGATSCGTVVSDATLGSAIANDNCPGVTVTRTGVPAGNVFPVGSTTVTYRATDRSGNFTEDTQIVTVTDNTAPVVTAPADVTLFTGPGATSCNVTVNNLDATLGVGTATDNCPGVGPVTRSGVPAGNVFPVGTTTLTYSATDAHSNTATDEQVVTVVDNTKPVITCPANIVLEPTCPSGAIATYSTPTATDNCGVQSVVRTAGFASGSVFPIGTTTVTHTATDIHGNTESCSFTVTVLTPQAVVQNLINAVNAMPSLTGQQRQGLLSKLQAALDAINGGQTNVACNKLNDFISQVQSFINNGTLTSAQGQPLINSAKNVRNTLGCTSLPCT